MQRADNQLVKRQTTYMVSVPAAAGISGGATATSEASLGPSLLLGASETTSMPSVTNPLVPGEPVITVTSSTPTQTDASPSSTLSSASASISTGAVVGISAGIFLVVIGTMFAIYTYLKKRAVSQTRRRLARGPPLVVRGAGGERGPNNEKQWNQRVNGGDRGEVEDKPFPGSANPTGARGKTPESDKCGLFEKDLSVCSVSDEKVSVSDNRPSDPSAMPNFAKYHSNLVGDLSNLPPSRPFAAREGGLPVVSWDGETVNGDPLLSLRASASDTMSPTAVMARQTPRTTDSAQHRWESAEVLIMNETRTERPSIYSEASQNPFYDDSDSRGGSNPFFNAAQHNPFSDRSTRSRKSSVSTPKRSRANSASSAGTVRGVASEGALLSLIAALDTAPIIPDGETNRTSIHTVASSLTDAAVAAAAPEAF